MAKTPKIIPIMIPICILLEEFFDWTFPWIISPGELEVAILSEISSLSVGSDLFEVFPLFEFSSLLFTFVWFILSEISTWFWV